MKRSLYLLTGLFSVLLFCACGQNNQPQPQTANPSAAAGLYGIYEGVLPAADCPGIHTVLTLKEDSSFEKTSEYLERDSTFREQGSFRVENGILTTTSDMGELFYYQLQDGALQQLDMQGNPIEGEMAALYILKKK